MSFAPDKLSAPALSSVSRGVSVPPGGIRATRQKSPPGYSSVSHDGLAASSCTQADAPAFKAAFDVKYARSPFGNPMRRCLIVRVPTRIASPVEVLPGTFTIFVASVGVMVDPDTLHGPTDDGTAG